ncbi:MAG: hypothetical protein KC609_04785, partial [Myxococcales bacterium]|nr:hypothetical protein [Myxococcales bacterium]
EKAGILRPGTPLVTGITERLFQSTVAPLCTRLDVPTSRLGVDFDVEYRVEGDAVARFVDAEYSLARLALCGRVQHQNAALAIAAVRQIGIGQRETIEAGLAAVRWPGRFEWLPGHPRPVLVDVAHNPDGARALANFLDESAPSRWHAVFAVQQGKKWESMLELVAPRCAELVFCPLPHPGGLDPLAAHDWARRAGHASSVADSASAAYNRARLGAGSAADASILIFGSHYLVGPLRHALTSEVASR